MWSDLDLLERVRCTTWNSGFGWIRDNKEGCALMQIIGINEEKMNKLRYESQNIIKLSSNMSNKYLSITGRCLWGNLEYNIMRLYDQSKSKEEWKLNIIDLYEYYFNKELESEKLVYKHKEELTNV